MDLKDIQKAFLSSEYNFLWENEHLGQNNILLGVGGSHAYGTDVPGSDLDIRGIALNRKEDILLGDFFEQVSDSATDTVIYSLYKIIPLLLNCNPNTIELIGLKPEHYLYVTDVGKEILDNKKLFLSQKAINSFGGYANAQLYRVNQKSAAQLNQKELEYHILKTLQHMQTTFTNKYSQVPTDGIKLYVDKSDNEEYDSEIFMDVNLTHYPLRDYKSMWSEFNTTVKSYSTVGRRNKNAIDHNKLGKHMMHLIRLHYMCFDLLEKGEVNTYRADAKEHALLMSIRNNEFLNSDMNPTTEFLELVNELQKRLEYDKTHTVLPEKPNYKEVNELVSSINERVIKGTISKTVCNIVEPQEDELER